jgi:hypothetical protein
MQLFKDLEKKTKKNVFQFDVFFIDRKKKSIGNMYLSHLEFH